MLDLVSKGMQMLQFVLPILLFIFSSILAWKMIKRGKELGQAWSTFLESPVSLVFAFVVIGLTLFMYFKFISPLLKGVGAS